MKKIALSLLLLLALGLNLKAQQYVSTEAAHRNVIIEEFTGRGCGYCPIAHRVIHEIMTANPGRAWGVAIHSSGSLSPTSSPNCNTAVSATISSAFPHDGIPSGVFNRSTSSGQGINESGTAWSNPVNQLLNQSAECNVGGVAVVNPDTRTVSITVEVYYTGNSNVSENYLTVVMLQDSILGYQSDYGNYNPGGWLNGTYVHMHVLRDVITPTWGEAISPTTQGTLITKTYEYQIPEIIGSPNGIPVDLDNISFLAWVSERYQGTPTRPILNACELTRLIGSNEPIYPMIQAVAPQPESSCSQTKVMEVQILNIGTTELTSMTVSAEFEGTTQTVNWEGSLPQFQVVNVEFVVEAPFGSHPMHVEITQANGVSIERSFEYQLNCLEWVDLLVEGETTRLKLLLMQDKWGAQTTWEFVTSDGTVLASGGPYSTLPGGGTSAHLETVDVPVNECVRFNIYDSGENGICCANGEGYYQIKDSNNNVLVDGAGDFGSMASHLISVKNPLSVESEAQESIKVYPNPANGYLMVEGQMTSVEICNAMGQSLISRKVNGNNVRLDLASFKNGIYFLRVNNNGEVETRKFSVNR